MKKHIYTVTIMAILATICHFGCTSKAAEPDTGTTMQINKKAEAPDTGTTMQPTKFDGARCGGIACNTGYICKQGSCQKPVVGDIIVFGHYEQDNKTKNGKEPIEWRVLDIDAAGQLLVISDKVLERKKYNETNPGYRGITWEKSTIRSWLNGYAASYNSDGRVAAVGEVQTRIECPVAAGEQSLSSKNYRCQLSMTHVCFLSGSSLS